MSKNDLPSEDKLLFHQALKQVKPLAASKKISIEEQRQLLKIKNDIPAKKPKSSMDKMQQIEKMIPKPPFYEERAARSKVLYLSNHYSEAVAAESVLSFHRMTLSQKRFMQLRQGRIRYESCLDLHGLKTETAKERLLQYIYQEERLNHRCLLIIHGKGSLRNEAPVLKNLLNCWLPQIPQVLAFHSALPQSGGTGAVYVLLKRKRDI